MNKVKLNEICQFLNGYAFKSKQYVDDGIRIIRIANVQKGKIIDDAPCFYPSNTINEIEKYLLSENDLLISLTGNVGRVGLLTRDMLPAALNQRVSCIRILNKNVVFFKYLYYYLQQNAFERDCIKASNGVAQLNLSTKWLENYQIFLPSLEEQQLIVTKIEELFSKLDKGVEELNKIKEQLKIYRQAVLKEAFEGNFLLPKRIPQYDLLEKFIEKPRYGTSKKCSYENDNSTPVYRIPNINIQDNTINQEDLKFAKFDESEFESLALQEGDVLIIRSNGSVSLVGRAAIIRKQDLSGLFAGYLMRLRICDFSKINPKYLIHFLNSHEARTYIEQTAKSTSGVNNINSSEICALKVPIFTLDEQNAIIREIESRLSVCEKVEQTVNQSLQKSESLRQSILKQAFEGKLV